MYLVFILSKCTSWGCRCACISPTAMTSRDSPLSSIFLPTTKTEKTWVVMFWLSTLTFWHSLLTHLNTSVRRKQSVWDEFFTRVLGGSTVLNILYEYIRKGNCVGYLYSSSEWFNCIKPPRTFLNLIYRFGTVEPHRIHVKNLYTPCFLRNERRFEEVRCSRTTPNKHTIGNLSFTCLFNLHV